MFWIKRSSRLAFVLEHPCGLRIERGLQVSAVQSIDGVSVSDMRTGYVWYRLPKVEIAGKLIFMNLGFYEHRLDSLHVADCNPEFGTSWGDWTMEKEKARADATKRWLAAVGYKVGKYPWGVVWAGTDYKTGDGRGVVRFHRT